jgi:two-component system nitrate/nitrite response regulator NarL
MTMPANGTRPLRVLLVDDHRLFLAAMRAFLDRAPEIEVVGEAPDGATSIQMAAALAPDCVAVDLSLPDMTGIEVIEQIRRTQPSVGALLMTGAGSEALAEDARAAGIDHLLSKSDALEKLLPLLLAAGRRP